MSTIDSRKIVLQILQNDGVYPGDPQLHSVYSYINDWSAQTYKLIASSRQVGGFISSPFVHTPRLLWDLEVGLTDAAYDLFPELKD